MKRISEVKPIDSSISVKKPRKICLGLIFKKKNIEDNGIEFRLNNILLKGNPHMDLKGPACRLCGQPYNSDLMYIRCETCQNWLHADAVELVESKIPEVVGFKCSKCRRLRSPICPYTPCTPIDKKAALETNQLNNGYRKQQPTEDTLKVDHGWNNTPVTGTRPRKLPIRRNISPKTI